MKNSFDKISVIMISVIVLAAIAAIYIVGIYNPFNFTFRQQCLTAPYIFIGILVLLIPYFIIRKQHIKKRCTVHTTAKLTDIRTEYKRNLDGEIFRDDETNEITVTYIEKYEYNYNGNAYTFTIGKTRKENRSGWDNDTSDEKPIKYIDIFINPDIPTEHYCGKKIGNGFLEALICLVIIIFILSVTQGI